jgi:hypothetical protein
MSVFDWLPPRPGILSSRPFTVLVLTRHTTQVARLDVGLLLVEAVATRRSSPHVAAVVGEFRSVRENVGIPCLVSDRVYLNTRAIRDADKRRRQT